MAVCPCIQLLELNIYMYIYLYTIIRTKLTKLTKEQVQYVPFLPHHVTNLIFCLPYNLTQDAGMSIAPSCPSAFPRLAVVELITKASLLCYVSK